MLRSLVLYTALVLGANMAMATDTAPAPLFALAQQGELAPDAEFSDLDGNAHKLSDFRGKPVLLNFWATWCAPCRKEMPALDALQAEMGEDLHVLTVASGRNAPRAIRQFFEDTGLENLPMMVDPKMDMARSFGAVGLPVTILIDAEGYERGRLLGDADWAGEAALATISPLLEP